MGKKTLNITLRLELYLYKLLDLEITTKTVKFILLQFKNSMNEGTNMFDCRIDNKQHCE